MTRILNLSGLILTGARYELSEETKFLEDFSTRLKPELSPPREGRRKKLAELGLI